MIKNPFLRTFSLGVKSLLLHKLRSGLTTLGMLFGVSSVVAMLAIGEGASKEAQLVENLATLDHRHKLTPEVRARIEDILDNQPQQPQY